jgi:branched-chain amino acid transport system permease protein
MTAAVRGMRVEQATEFVRQHRSISIIIAMTLTTVLLPLIVLLPPFNVFQGQVVWLDGFSNAGVAILLALGLNIVVGMSGLLDLGYAAFFAIGAYTYAYAASPYSGNHFPFLPMLLVAAVMAATFGVLLGAPTLRLRGDYLAIVTLGFGEIVPIVFQNSDLFTGGVNGISGIDKPNLPIIGTFDLLNPWPFYLLMAFMLTLVFIMIYRLEGSRIGRAWNAIREDELAAAASGLNTVVTKLLAFALGASTAGFAGVFNGAKLTIVSPDQFQFTVSFTVLVAVVLGGMGNIWGVALGAFIVYTIQAVLLKQLNAFFANFRDVPVLDFFARLDFVQYQFLLFGLALVTMMLLRPEGLFPSQRRRRELYEVGAEAEAEAESKTGVIEALPDEALPDTDETRS